jgi:hypothetical protein
VLEVAQNTGFGKSRHGILALVVATLDAAALAAHRRVTVLLARQVLEASAAPEP